MASIDASRYKALSVLKEWRDNYNRGDVEGIALSIRRFGMNQSLRVWRDNVVMAGNHTLKALRLIQQEGAKPSLDRQFPPENVIVKGDEWYVQFVDVSHLDTLEAKAFAIADNALARKAVTDDRLLAQYLSEIVTASEPMLEATGYDRAGLDALLAAIGAESLNASTFNTSPDADVAERLRKIDIIYTSGTMGRGGSGAELTRWIQVHCCLAVKSGWLYGLRSSDGVCGTVERQEAHRPQFIDNHYHHYDHKQHLSAVQRWKPKYATVRDIMTKAQCKAAGIEFYPLEQILEWASELSAHAENVILIPKYDCIDKLPERYMLGYSIPTSYGGTPLSIEHFKGRRVHLLGGSPRRQVQYFQALQDEVVSLDNNYILKIAHFGRVFIPSEGVARGLSDLGMGAVSNPLYAALVLNFGLFAAYFQRPVAEDVAVLLSHFDEDASDNEAARESGVRE